jgi:septal ring factor EnvC (AmiA/AmiB activator)
MTEESKKINHFRSSLKRQFSETERLRKQLADLKNNNSELTIYIASLHQKNKQLSDSVDGLTSQLHFIQDQRDLSTMEAKNSGISCIMDYLPTKSITQETLTAVNPIEAIDLKVNHIKVEEQATGSDKSLESTKTGWFSGWW